MTTHLYADGSFAKELWLPAPGNAFGSERISHQMLEEGLHYPQMNGKTANLRINSKVAEMLGIPESKVFNTIQNYGNTTAATIPLGMDDAIKAGVLKKGMLVASAAFGSGFTWASAVWRY
ncbi:unnamed protein product [Notodromas monacha]|uniref:Beta-ketoacyl-[acyl-carrier-protein] synthase III C-terminal domain-containing protein n=1 Tax=Notodromas monacha TaxID=399045 RepID=A0A7R9C2D4_9CRUS|nr:unnamed protein product [Notodromas monacha]CAG0926076.1 unnamed protein product [Notodromas monacha]